ncbi:MAG: hypothetical protein WCF17_18675 [Terracidiphilus sp.]
MNRWAQANSAWEPLLKGNPASSSYFWMAIIFSLSALLGIAKVTMKIYGNSRQEMVWLPSLGGALALMAIAAIGAARAIRAARPPVKEPAEVSAAAAQKAFEKFRVYFFCAALVALASWTLAAFIL